MTARSILAMLALAATGASASVVIPADPQRELKAVADRLHSTVIEVRALAAVPVPASGSGEELVPTASVGTGVLLGDGLAVTTLHTVGVMVRGKLAPWKNVQALVPGVGPAAVETVAWFPDVDLALVRVSGTGALSGAPLSTGEPERGAALVAMGADNDAVNVVGLRAAGVSGDDLLMTSDRGIDSRYWGGPVFDTSGRLVGITIPSVMPKAITSGALRAMVNRTRSR